MRGTGPTVRTAVENGVAIVTLDRVHANAINDELVDDLLDAYHAAEEDPSVGERRSADIEHRTSNMEHRMGGAA